MYGLFVQKVDLNDAGEKLRVNTFLESFGLVLDKDVDYTIVIKENDRICATCSKAKNVLKCFAVAEDIRGEGVTSTLISSLIDKLFEEGIYHSFIFTKPDKIQLFSSLNYKLIYQVKEAALLENGMSNIITYLTKLKKDYNLSDNKKTALVMNCNPFTLGHQYLIEMASQESEEVLVFIVEEDRSLFPFKVRYDLVKEGTKHLKNVKILPGGEYIISSATFPAYFLREESIRLKSYTEIDAGIFSKYFCSFLNINKRFVGKEPFCNVTNAYNETLKNVLDKYNIKLVEIERKKYTGSEISASMVRNLIKGDKLSEMKAIVPESTWEFLNTAEGREIAEKIKRSNSPH